MDPSPQYVRDEQMYNSSSTRVTIFKGRMLPNGTPVAIKEQMFSSLALANTAIKEALSMSTLTHPSICTIYTCFMEATPTGEWKSVLLLELMDSDLGKEAENRKRNNYFWSEAELMNLLRQLISALSYAQKLGVSHRDIKPQNIFMSGSMVKIGDFGSSDRSLEDKFKMRSTLIGSPLFFSPEMKRMFIKFIQTGNETETLYDPYLSDVYSLGVTMLNLAYCSPPVQLLDLDSLESSVDSLCSGLTGYPELSQWIRRMLVTEPSQRPNFILLDTWLNSGPMQMTPSGMSQTLGANLLHQEQSGYVYDQQGAYMSEVSRSVPVLRNADMGQVTPLATSTSRDMTSPSAIYICTQCHATFIPGQAHPNLDFCSQQCGRQAKLLRAKPCSACAQPILDNTWATWIPPDMHGLEAFIGEYCSLNCFRALGIYRCSSCGIKMNVQHKGKKYCYQCIQNFTNGGIR